MTNHQTLPLSNVTRDFIAGLAVFFVALPLCLGIALASRATGVADAANVPLFAGIIAAIIGGVVVGCISGSHTSVAGPAAGLTAIVATQVGKLGTFDAFLLAVMIAGLMQIALGLLRAGFIAAFVPSSVIKGLLAAIGVTLILKQLPHVLGHDADPMGEDSFLQPDNQNTFSELLDTWFDFQPGATAVGILSVAIMLVWDRVPFLRRLPVPAPVAVVGLGVALAFWLRELGGQWVIESSHFVQVPVAQSPSEFLGFLRYPDFSAWNNPAVYATAFAIAVAASLETLLNIDAVDKIDPKQRVTPASRELLAQGFGNVFAGLIGGLPITSVLARSSVNINAGVKTKLSTIWHGLLLLGCVMLMPAWLNRIPLAAVAGVLLVTGLKLASPQLFKQMWKEGGTQFLPFIVTVIAIVLTDLLTGILIGLGVALAFILHSNFRRPMRRIMEKHATGDVLRVELANQVSFLNRAALEQTLRAVPRGGHVLIDAQATDYIDPDVLDLITDYKNTTAAARGVHLSLAGFRDRYPHLEDRIQFIDYSSREVQSNLTPQRVIEILIDGNERFRTGNRLTRDLGRQVHETATGQFPMAVVLSCIDSRTPAELVFDLGLGDVFSIRIAGNVARNKVLGSLEYSCAVAGAPLILVMGHSSCGAVNAAVSFMGSRKSIADATGCANLELLISVIQESIDPGTCKKPDEWQPGEKAAYADAVARRNVLQTMIGIRHHSSTLDRLVREGKLAIVGAFYDIGTGEVSFFQTAESSVVKLPIPMVPMV